MLYMPILFLFLKRSNIYTERKKNMTLKCLCTHIETFSSLAFEAMLTELLVQTIEKMYQLYQEHFKIYSFNQLIVGKYKTPLFSSLYGENNVCSALVVAKCMYFGHPKFSNVVG